MTDARSLEKAVELYNEVVNLDEDEDEDRNRLQQLIWQLRSADRQKFDVKTKVALQFALLKSGQRNEACALAADFSGYLWAEADVLMTMAASASYTADYEFATKLLKDLLARPGLGQVFELAGIADHCSFLSGNVGWIEEMVHDESIREDTRIDMAGRLELLERLGILPYFTDHQAIVRKIVGEYQCGAAVSACSIIEDGEPYVANRLMVAADTATRRQILENLRIALIEYYTAQRVDDPVALSNALGTYVTSHPAFQERQVA